MLKALECSDVPVPHVYGYCADTDRIGTSFYVMEYVEGQV